MTDVAKKHRWNSWSVNPAHDIVSSWNILKSNPSQSSTGNHNPLPIGSMYGIYANIKGVYWWDPCYHIEQHHGSYVLWCYIPLYLIITYSWTVQHLVARFNARLVVSIVSAPWIPAIILLVLSREWGNDPQSLVIIIPATPSPIHSLLSTSKSLSYFNKVYPVIVPHHPDPPRTPTVASPASSALLQKDQSLPPKPKKAV